MFEFILLKPMFYIYSMSESLITSNNSDVGIIDGKIRNGLFGSTLTWILEILPYLKKNGIYPDWQIDTYCYGPIFPNIIKPKHITSKSNIKIDLIKLKSEHPYTYKESECNLAHDLFFEYFDIPNDILENVENIIEKFAGKTLGVHFRGTDKFNLEADYISQDDVLKNIIAFLSKSNEFHTIFVMSDEASFITKINSEFSNKKYNIIYTNSLRSNNNEPIHPNRCNINNAKEAIIDSLILSKCDYIIKTSSCLSDWVKIWNPSIEVYNLNKFRYTWFPQSIIPVKTYI